MHPADLETIVDAELKRLQMPRAPRTLLPRVLAAVHEWSLRPWYTREWFTWPFGWRLASVAALVFLIVSAVMVLPVVQTAAADVAARVGGGRIVELGTVVRIVEASMTTARVIWQALVEPFLGYVFVLVVLMCVACLAFGMALNQLVLGRAVLR